MARLPQEFSLFVENEIRCLHYLEHTRNVFARWTRDVVVSKIQEIGQCPERERVHSYKDLIWRHRPLIKTTSLHSGRFVSLDCNCTTSPNTDNPAVRSVKSIFHHTKEAIVLVDRQRPRVQIQQHPDSVPRLTPFHSLPLYK